MVKRKGFTQAWFGFVRMAEQNKKSVVTASILLYALGYLLVGIGGISFQVQPATGYVTTGSNTACPSGSMWIEGNNLHWCDGSREFSAVDKSGDSISLVDGSSSGPGGAVWIEGNRFHWIDTNSNEYAITGGDTGDNPSASAGAVWVEDGRIHYIDTNGNERIFKTRWSESFETYSDGTTPSNMNGWYAGSECGTCEVSNNRADDGSMSFYQNVASNDDWQEVLMKDISSTPIKHEATVAVKYWESTSNHDGNLWVRACDGTNIAGIGTENPQYEGVTGSNGEVVNSGDDYQEYQRWTHARMEIDLDGNTVDFVWSQDGTGAYERSTGHTIPSGKDICTIGVGPDDVWYVDSLRIEGY